MFLDTHTHTHVQWCGVILYTLWMAGIGSYPNVSGQGKGNVSWRGIQWTQKGSSTAVWLTIVYLTTNGKPDNCKHNVSNSSQGHISVKPSIEKGKPKFAKQRGQEESHYCSK